MAEVINGGTGAKVAAANEAQWDSGVWGVKFCLGSDNNAGEQGADSSDNTFSSDRPLSATPQTHREAGGRAFQSQHIYVGLDWDVSPSTSHRLHSPLLGEGKAAITDVCAVAGGRAE